MVEEVPVGPAGFSPVTEETSDAAALNREGLWTPLFCDEDGLYLQRFVHNKLDTEA